MASPVRNGSWLRLTGERRLLASVFAGSLCFVLSVLSSSAIWAPASIASDWEEESPKRVLKPGERPTSQDTVILDENNSGGESSAHGHKAAATNGVLQGNATAVRTAAPQIQPTSSMLQAEYAQRVAAIQRVDAEAYRFLQMANTNVITPPSVFRGFLEKTHPEFDLSGAANNVDSILVVRGQWDDSTKPLRSFGLKFTQIKVKDLPEHSLSKFKVVIVDCAGEIPKEQLKKFTDYVGYGGYLITTDWALENLVQQAIPGFIQWNRDYSDGDITDAFILDTESPLLNGLSGRRFTWKMDKESQCLRVLNAARVHLIARSSRLSIADPQLRVLPDPLLAGGLAAEFNFGRGKLLHLVGHFDNCSTSFKLYNLPDPAPGAGISLRQVLAANFIIEALEQKPESADSSDAQNANASNGNDAKKTNSSDEK